MEVTIKRAQPIKGTFYQKAKWKEDICKKTSKTDAKFAIFANPMIQFIGGGEGGGVH